MFISIQLMCRVACSHTCSEPPLVRLLESSFCEFLPGDSKRKMAIDGCNLPETNVGFPEECCNVEKGGIC
jgi:hypothetical protein